MSKKYYILVERESSYIYYEKNLKEPLSFIIDGKIMHHFHNTITFDFDSDMYLMAPLKKSYDLNCYNVFVERSFILGYPLLNFHKVLLYLDFLFDKIIKEKNIELYFIIDGIDEYDGYSKYDLFKTAFNSSIIEKKYNNNFMGCFNLNNICQGLFEFFQSVDKSNRIFVNENQITGDRKHIGVDGSFSCLNIRIGKEDEETKFFEQYLDEKKIISEFERESLKYHLIDALKKNEEITDVILYRKDEEIFLEKDVLISFAKKAVECRVDYFIHCLTDNNSIVDYKLINKLKSPIFNELFLEKLNENNIIVSEDGFSNNFYMYAIRYIDCVVKYNSLLFIKQIKDKAIKFHIPLAELDTNFVKNNNRYFNLYGALKFLNKKSELIKIKDYIFG